MLAFSAPQTRAFYLEERFCARVVKQALAFSALEAQGFPPQKRVIIVDPLVDFVPGQPCLAHGLLLDLLRECAFELVENLPQNATLPIGLHEFALRCRFFLDGSV